jgi:lipopolysaccharide export LptBFGC system permease protein LptF
VEFPFLRLAIVFGVLVHRWWFILGVAAARFVTSPYLAGWLMWLSQLAFHHDHNQFHVLGGGNKD